LRLYRVGALLDGVSSALKNKDSIKFSELPRLADTAHWIEAGIMAFSWEKESYLNAQEAMRAGLMYDAAKSDIVATTMFDWLAFQGTDYVFKGTATMLLRELEDYSGSPSGGPKHNLHRKFWPAAPAQLGKHLRRIGVGLDAMDIECEISMDSKKRSNYCIYLRSAQASLWLGGTKNDVKKAGGNRGKRGYLSVDP